MIELMLATDKSKTSDDVELCYTRREEVTNDVVRRVP
jgi:hypothetical protein